MPIIYTASARLKDWKGLRDLHEHVLLARAQQCGAQRYALYRNVNDAAQVLLLAEFAEADGLREFLGTWFEDASVFLGNVTANDSVWEPLGWEVIA